MVPAMTAIRCRCRKSSIGARPLKPTASDFARRIQHRQHCRHQRDAADERDQHATAGNQSEFRKAAIIGRQKCEKSHGGSRGGQSQRIAGLAGGRSQRLAQIAVFMPFAAIAHAELNAEIDPKADKQHEERDRDQVEGADQSEPQRGCRRKSHHQAEEHRAYDFPGTKRQPENDQHAEQRHQGVAQRAVPDDRELVVVHRHLSGEIDLGAELAGKVEIGRCLMNPLGGRAAGLQRLEIKRRLNFDKVL